MGTVTLGGYPGEGVDTDQLNVDVFVFFRPMEAAPDHIKYQPYGDETDTFFGSFTFDSRGIPVAGTVTSFLQYSGTHLVAEIAGVNSNFEGLLSSNTTAPLFILDGNDTITGTMFNDTINSQFGDDVVFAGDGDDVIRGLQGRDYLRGEGGNDLIGGGDDFDDINGNAGNDTCYGHLGDDWVVGGKDQDFLSGGPGFDIVYGNMGNDTISGDEGDDWVRGGQGNDSVSGGDGNDWLWGDLGNDTLSGGAGADIFHSFAGSGVDRVMDFNRAEGDQIQLDPGTVYTVKQVGADTVVNIAGGAQMVLVGVQTSSLTGNWLFVG